MLYQVAAQNATGALGPPAERAQNFSWLALGYSVSGFIGPLLAGFTLDNASFDASFVTLALLPLVPVAVLGRGALALPHPHAPHARATPGSVAAMFRNRQMRRVFVVNALLSVAWDLHTFFIPIYGARLGLSASVIGRSFAGRPSTWGKGSTQNDVPAGPRPRRGRHPRRGDLPGARLLQAGVLQVAGRSGEPAGLGRRAPDQRRGRHPSRRPRVRLPVHR